MGDTTRLFRYTLTDVETRSVPGEYGFVVQVNYYNNNVAGKNSVNVLLQMNPKRVTHRRRPADMYSLQQPFDPDLFHFNKINPNEVSTFCKLLACTANNVD